MRKIMPGLLLLGASIVGLLIALVDTSPGWDDTGITVAALLLSTALFGGLSPKRAWRWAMAVGLWIPALNIVFHNNYGSLIALAFAFAGAYLGAFGRRLLLDICGSAASR